MSESAVAITFDNKLGDHLAAERLYYRFTVFWKLDKVVAGLLILFGAYLMWLAGVQWWTVIWFPLAVAEWFNILSLRPLQIWLWFKHNPKFRETYHLVADPSGLHFKTESIDSKLTWSHFSRVLEDGRLLLLIYGTRMYSVIPKRAFRSEDELGRFRSLATAAVGGRG